MGRNKLHKPKKPPKSRPVALPVVLGKFDQEDVWALLVAAGASPNLRERWSSIGFLVHTCAQTQLLGSNPVDPSTIWGLLTAVGTANPQHAHLEDYISPDPRLDVRVRLGDATVRLFPGSIERPVADVDRALMVSAVIDAKLVAERGFGIADVLRVAVGYVDFAVERFAAIWPDDEPGDGEASFTSEELVAARELIALGTPRHLVADERAKLALEWLTCDATDLGFDPGHAQSPFGRFLRVRGAPQDEPRWLPLAFIPEILSFAVGELAKTADSDAAMQFAFAQSSAAATREYLWKFADMVYGPPDLPDGPAVSPHNVVQWVAPIGPQLVLAVQVASRLNADKIHFSEELAVVKAAKTAAGGRGVTIALAAGTVTLDPGVEVIPLLVVSTADHVMTRQGGGFAAVSLDDLRWMSTSADNEFDLLNFCRDVTRPAMARSIGFEAIDYWETWRGNGKAFFTGGQTGAIMVIEPHAGEAEWTRSAEWTQTEATLAALGLPALRETVGVSHARESPVSVYKWSAPDLNRADDSIPNNRAGRHFRPAPEGWSVHTGPIPVAVSIGDASQVEREYRQLLHRMAGSIGFTIEGIVAKWTAAHSRSGVTGYLLQQVIHDEGAPDGRTQWVTDVSTDSRGVVRATLNVHFDGFTEMANADASAIRGEFAGWLKELLVAAGIDSMTAQGVLTAVLAAPPTMTLNVTQTQTTRNNLGTPVDLDDAFVSAADREIAERVRAAGVSPGIFQGVAAKALDRDVLAVIALELLGERLRGYDSDQLVRFGMEQLQRTVENRNRNMENVRRSAEELSLSWDPVDHASETQATSHLLRRSNEIAVEAALRSTPSGDKIMDEPTWGGILAAAKAYLEATMRSESVHYQVTPTAIRITDLFQISPLSGQRTIPASGDRPVHQLDAAAYSEAMVREGFKDKGDESEVPEPLQAAIEAEMLAAFGASAMDIYTALFSLAGIQLEPDEPEVRTMSVKQAIAWVLEGTVLGDEADGEARVAAAVAMLTTTSEDLKADDWRPWHARTRRKRLLVQPLPTLSNGEILIAPHFLLASLGVYRTYLQQGQLPWSQPAPPASLERALERFRDEKNAALERDIVAILRAKGWTVVSNIKETKPGRLGLSSLSTEIDAVAGRPGDPVIHLLEAKDPASVFATPQISRQLDDFYLDGKKNSYSTQLKRKHADLAPYADRVANALGLPVRDQGDPYWVKTTFVTRAPVPAAFVGGPFPFLTVATLIDGLDLTT